MWQVNYEFSNSIKDHSCLLNRYHPHELGVREVENGVILPLKKDRSLTYGLGGVLDQEDTFIVESSFYLPFNRSDSADWGGFYSYENKGNISEEQVIFGGFINNNEWGHFITDWSQRLWYPIQSDPDSRIVFCQRGNDRLLANIRKVLEIIGIPEERLLLLREGDEPIRFSRILIPEPSISPKGYTDQFRVIFEKAAEEIKRKNPNASVEKRIYMTRTGLRPLKDYGEEELEDFFRKNGFHIMEPEKLPIEEQILLLSGCEELASLEGSAAHNVVFAKKGIHQIILEKSQAVNVRQLYICQSGDIRVDFVGTYPKFKFYDYYSCGPFLVGITGKFCRYTQKSGEFKTEANKKIIVWMKNYVVYIVNRIVKGTGRFFARAGRRLFTRGKT